MGSASSLPPARAATQVTDADEERLPVWLGPLILATVFAWLAWWSWGKWTDVQIDFGTELYLPWQMTEGRLLYHDLAYRNGPLSHGLNAALFNLLGVSLRTLVWTNLTILALITTLTYRIFRLSCGRLTATVTGLVLLIVFGFSQYVPVGNFNYVTPYNHAQTHGLAVTLALILALSSALRSGRAATYALAGCALGLAFLTKIELFLPAAGVSIVALSFALLGRRTRVTALLGLPAGALVPVAVALLLLGATMPWETALDGILGNWRYLGRDVLADPFYAAVAGLDEPARHLRITLGASGWLALSVAGVGGLALLWPARARRPALAVCLGLGLFALLATRPELVRWTRQARALPVTTLALGAGLLFAAVRRERLREQAVPRWAPLALWATMALLLLVKIPLRTRVFHYGFVLAMPACLLLVAGLVHLLPRGLEARAGWGRLARSLAVGTCLAGALALWTSADRAYAAKDVVVGRGADAIVVENPRVDPRGTLVAAALESLERRLSPDDTILVLPEGIGLNYWLRRRNPTPFDVFTPTVVQEFGGPDVVLEELRRHPPDVIVLMDRLADEFGVGPFGVDPRNGRDLLAWVRRGYTLVERLGAAPFEGRGFGIEILRRQVR